MGFNKQVPTFMDSLPQGPGLQVVALYHGNDTISRVLSNGKVAGHRL